MANRKAPLKDIDASKPRPVSAGGAMASRRAKKANPERDASTARKGASPKAASTPAAPAAAKRVPASGGRKATPSAPGNSRLGKMALDSAKRLVSDHISVGDRITEIVQDWANAESEPPSDAVLSTLWGNSGSSAPFTIGAQDLTTRLNNDLGSKLRPTDIKTDTSLSDLIQMIV